MAALSKKGEQSQSIKNKGIKVAEKNAGDLNENITHCYKSSYDAVLSELQCFVILLKKS